MIKLHTYKKHLVALTNLAMLYAGKTSGVLVALFFLPLYNRLLGSEQFGMVAVILSLQALLTMLDLGMSTMVGREIAAAESNSIGLFKLIRTAEVSLSSFYVLLLIGIILLKIIAGIPTISLGTALMAVLLFWVLVLQNLYCTAILARRAYTAASIIQVIGVTIRAGATAYALTNISGDLSVFIATQLIFGTIHYWGTKYYYNQLFHFDSSTKKNTQITKNDVITLLIQGKSLALFAAAGAAVTQLDKPIVSAFMSTTSLTPYFLATTLCMMPISILAGPVSQYFQPALLNFVAQKNTQHLASTIKRFVTILTLVTLVPSLCFWFLRAPMINLWMGQNSNNFLIAHYVKILLPGFAFGALGYIPYSLLLSAKDFKFQALLSTSLSIVTLCSVTIFAFLNSVELVCYVYAIYHFTSTLLSWIRAMSLFGTREMAKLSFALTMKMVIGFCIISLMIKYLFDQVISI